jgi:peptidoglycan glycosyltransferase
VNGNIRRIGIALLAGFLLIAVALPYWQIIKADDLTGDPTYNRYRLSEVAKATQRGRILDRNGIVLVSNDPNDPSKRVYAKPWLVSVTGYHSAIYGDTGVEGAAGGLLTGQTGLDETTALIDNMLHRPVIGADVVLTIDSQLQDVAEQAMGASNGAVVALDPKTGEILAMVSHPYADPNQIEANWDTIKDNPNAPLLNRATQGLYVPGSAFETVTLAAALDTGLTEPSEVFDFPIQTDQNGQPSPTLDVDGYDVFCANPGGASSGDIHLGLADAYAGSCNAAFAQLGLRLGSQRLGDYARRFGLESELPIDIPSLASKLTISPNATFNPISLAATAFGQGQLQVTPLQLAETAATVADGGVAPKLYVEKQVQNGATTQQIGQAGDWHPVVSAATAQQVLEMMVQSVQTGTASSAKIDGVSVAGKVGTAEVNTGETPHAVFIGFAPADNPAIAVAVVMENAGGGGAEAAPVAKKVLEAALAKH